MVPTAKKLSGSFLIFVFIVLILKFWLSIKYMQDIRVISWPNTNRKN